MPPSRGSLESVRDSSEFGEDVEGDKLEKLTLALRKVHCIYSHLQRCDVLGGISNY